MIYFTKEGERIKNGFNFYPLNDKASFGVRIRFGRRVFRARYSTYRKRWFISNERWALSWVKQPKK